MTVFENVAFGLRRKALILIFVYAAALGTENVLEVAAR
jgi:hypothetical protein